MTDNERAARDQAAYDEMMRGWEAAEADRLGSTPTDDLSDEQKGLLEFAEYLADGLETGGIMLLTFEEAAFMEQVCRWDGLIVPFTAIAAIRIALHLEEGGLVTIERRAGDMIVSAVRPESDND